jgi:hypothetical protein
MGSVQAPDAVMMVRPAMFRYNEQTAVSNAFQQDAEISDNRALELAIEEFDTLVRTLNDNGVNTIVFNDYVVTYTPDAVFPNNWIAFMPDSSVWLFPMEADNRRMERRTDIPEVLRDDHGFSIKQIIDISENELRGRFLEGTGSIVFDHVHKVAYANQSTRTNPDLFNEFCTRIGYAPVLFVANDADGNMIYHTNVIMAIGEKFAVICLAAIDEMHRGEVIKRLEDTGHEIIELSFDQITHFAGNMIELSSEDGNRLIVMSEEAFHSLSEDQLHILEKYGKIIYSPIPTIEKLGGGSVRCMIAAIHSPKLN